MEIYKIPRKHGRDITLKGLLQKSDHTFFLHKPLSSTFFSYLLLYKLFCIFSLPTRSSPRIFADFFFWLIAQHRKADKIILEIWVFRSFPLHFSSSVAASIASFSCFHFFFPETVCVFIYFTICGHVASVNTDKAEKITLFLRFAR